jgi:SAM-dependent methyltransferase
MRDTDLDWRYIAKHQPYHGVLSNPQYLDPDAGALREFFETGELDVGHLDAIFRRQFGDFSPRTALDFGCGVGRLLIPMARKAGHAFGVDVADDMLKLAEHHCREAGVSFELANTIPEGRHFDWVNSVIVFQHIPPARGYALIRALWNAVAAGGYLSLHVTIFKERAHRGELERDLDLYAYDGERVVNYSLEHDPAASMSMYDYDLSRVMAAIDLEAGHQVLMEKVRHGGCHGFRIYLQKA